MGKARLALQSCSSDTSSDDLSSDEELYSLDLGRYQAASIAEGLRSRHYRLSALQELQEVVTQGYASANKKAQTAVFEDLLVAVQQLDSRQKVYQARTSLVTAAKRALPQQKRNQLVKEQKQAALANNRAARRQGGVIEDDSEDDHPHLVVLGDVPLEVVRRILQALDPLSLAAAACVCRSWHQLATSDDLWRQHLQLVFPGSGKKQQQGPKQSRQWNKRLHDFAQQAAVDSAAAASAAGFAAQVHGSNSNSSSRDEQQGDTGAYQRFCKAAQCHPSKLLPWRSCRALLCGHLQWMPPGNVHAPRAAAAARAARRGVLTPGPIYVTCNQAVAWMLGKPWSDVLRDSATNSSASGTGSDSGSGSEGSSEGDESHANSLRLCAI